MHPITYEPLVSAGLVARNLRAHGPGLAGASKAARSDFRHSQVRSAGPASVSKRSSRKPSSSSRHISSHLFSFRLFPTFLPHTRGFPCLSYRPSTTTCVLTPVFWVSAFFRSIRDFTNSMTQFRRGSGAVAEAFSGTNHRNHGARQTLA